MLTSQREGHFCHLIQLIIRIRRFNGNILFLPNTPKICLLVIAFAAISKAPHY